MHRLHISTYHQTLVLLAVAAEKATVARTDRYDPFPELTTPGFQNKNKSDVLAIILEEKDPVVRQNKLWAALFPCTELGAFFWKPKNLSCDIASGTLKKIINHLEDEIRVYGVLLNERIKKYLILKKDFSWCYDCIPQPLIDLFMQETELNYAYIDWLLENNYIGNTAWNTVEKDHEMVWKHLDESTAPIQKLYAGIALNKSKEDLVPLVTILRKFSSPASICVSILALAKTHDKESQIVELVNIHLKTLFKKKHRISIPSCILRDLEKVVPGFAEKLKAHEESLKVPSHKAVEDLFFTAMKEFNIENKSVEEQSDQWIKTVALCDQGIQKASELKDVGADKDLFYALKFFSQYNLCLAELKNPTEEQIALKESISAICKSREKITLKNLIVEFRKIKLPEVFELCVVALAAQISCDDQLKKEYVEKLTTIPDFLNKILYFQVDLLQLMPDLVLKKPRETRAECLINSGLVGSLAGTPAALYHCASIEMKAVRGGQTQEHSDTSTILLGTGS